MMYSSFGSQELTKAESKMYTTDADRELSRAVAGFDWFKSERIWHPHLQRIFSRSDCLPLVSAVKLGG